MLEQGIAQVAKGSEVPTEAKYEMEDGKLMLSIYTSAKGQFLQRIHWRRNHSDLDAEEGSVR